MGKKNCNRCGKLKDEEELNWRYKALGIRHPTCRECQKPFRKNWYEGNKLQENLVTRMQDCGIKSVVSITVQSASFELHT